MIKKLFIFLIKYIPVIQMAGIIVNNILYSLDNDVICKIIDFIFGNSLTTVLLFYICSYVFRFCKWHKLVITCNLINILIATIDVIYPLTKTNEHLILLYITPSIILNIPIILSVNSFLLVLYLFSLFKYTCL